MEGLNPKLGIVVMMTEDVLKQKVSLIVSGVQHLVQGALSDPSQKRALENLDLIATTLSNLAEFLAVPSETPKPRNKCLGCSLYKEKEDICFDGKAEVVNPQKYFSKCSVWLKGEKPTTHFEFQVE